MASFISSSVESCAVRRGAGAGLDDVGLADQSKELGFLLSFEQGTDVPYFGQILGQVL